MAVAKTTEGGREACRAEIFNTDESTAELGCGADAVAVAISRADLDASGIALLLVVFVVVASITIGIPVIYTLVAGEKAEAQLARSKTWLVENNARVVAVMMFVIGLFLIVKAVGEIV